MVFKANFCYNLKSMEVITSPNNANSEVKFSTRPRPTHLIDRREIVIDYLRGFAVALMIITHVIAITFNGSSGNELVKNIGLIGGIGSFTSFLFISGISSFLSFVKNDDSEAEKIKQKGRRIIAKNLQLLGIYYILATFSIFVNTSLYSFPPNTGWIETITKTVFFIIVPPFTEFLLALLAFSLSTVFLRKLYRFLLNNPLIGLPFMGASFAIGSLIYKVDFGATELNSIKALFGGHLEYHTFPLFQYLPIFLLGLYFGKFLYNNADVLKRLKLNFIWLIIFGTFTIQSYFVFNYFDYQIFDALPDSGRFPPSLAFIALSLTITLSAMFIITALFKAIPSLIKAPLHFMGVNALDMFFFHTAILFLYKYLTSSSVNPNGKLYSGTITILFLYFVVIALSIIFTNVRRSFKDWSTQENGGDLWWFFTERAVSSIIFVIIFGIVGTTFYRDVFANPASLDTANIQFKKRLIREEEWPIWWDNGFEAFRQLMITAPASDNLFKNSWVSASFNHREALNNGRAYYENGSDVRVVFYDSVLGEFKELPFKFESIGTESASVTFKLVEDIPSATQLDRYFIYYGNEFIRDFTDTKDTPSGSVFASGVSVNPETIHSIDASVNRRWYLKKKETAYQAASLVVSARLNNENIADGSIVTYSIPGTDKFGRMKQVNGRDYQASIVVSDLEPGIYSVVANVTESKDDLKIFRSQEIPFYITYPIYVTWTQDWEGFDVNQVDLDSMASIADQHGMPMVHLFNPRIYIRNQYSYANISESRAKYISDWVKERQQERFEEIGMHMHMFPDMVSEAGVAPKYDVVVGAAYGDTKTNAYTEEELTKIFSWGRQKFSENALGAPISYRTGAWMSGPNVLKAAQNTGFLIDTTGRTGGPINPAQPSSSQVPWSLSVTTYPYLPSVSDINKWEGDRLNIWEFPNNGADSFWFSLQELISRFDQNYPNKGSIVTRPQVVTYLSHPHWFAGVDSPKIRGLFSYTDQFLFKNDAGPVIYATLEDIYSQWDRDKFINGN